MQDFCEALMLHSKLRYSALVCLLAGAALALADDARPVDGTLSISGRQYKLQYAVAYETTIFDKSAIAIVASGSPITTDAVKKALADTKDQPDVWLRQPHVKVGFDGKGNPSSYYVSAAGFAANAGGDALVGEIKRDGERVSGKARLPAQGDGDLQRSF